jgi:flagellar basal body-associated protein FliL
MEDKLEHLIQSLKEAKPVLKNPADLTDSIMDQIGKQSGLKITPMLIWVRVALSAAAVLLLGLFVFQQSEAETATATASVKPVIENKLEADSTCMQMLGSEHLNYLKTYLCYLQQNSIENKLNKSYPLQKN